MIKAEVQNQSHFRDALSCFATGVTIITTRYQDQDIGMTCSSFNTVSLDPALVLWSIQKTIKSRNAFIGTDMPLTSQGYTVSVLNLSQKDLAYKFASGTQNERFSSTEIERAPSGRAIIKDCVAWFDCQRYQVINAGDHDILLGKVEFFNAKKLNPGLIFERSQFGSLQSCR
jgi:flavin reductase (DIM6/NTAB) family NADH-FMN oxidoreductase RutF